MNRDMNEELVTKILEVVNEYLNDDGAMSTVLGSLDLAHMQMEHQISMVWTKRYFDEARAKKASESAGEKHEDNTARY